MATLDELQLQDDGATLTQPSREPAITRSDITLGEMPIEILRDIVDYLFLPFVLDCRPWDSEYEDEYRTRPWAITPHISDVWGDISRLARASRRLHDTITPYLYGLDARYNGASALLISTKRNIPSAVAKSLEAGADVDAIDTTEPTCEKAQPRPRRYQPPDPEEQKWEHEPITLTALHWAALRGHEQVVDLLLDWGADVGHSGQTCVGINASSPIDFTCKSFIRAMIQIKCRSTGKAYASCSLYLEYNTDALYFALLESRSESQQAKSAARAAIAKRLIQAGSSLITHTGVGLHALHQACADWNPEVVEWLLDEVGVDPNVPDAMDNTPLHHVAMWRDYPATLDPGPVIRLLVERGADINARNADDDTPLQACFRRKSRYSQAAYWVTIELFKGGACLPDAISGYKKRPYFERDEMGRVLQEARARGLAKKLDEPEDLEERKERAFKMANHWVYSRANFGKSVSEEVAAWSQAQWRRYWIDTTMGWHCHDPRCRDYGEEPVDLEVL